MSKVLKQSKMTNLKFTRAVKAFNLKIMDPENSYINDCIEEDLMPYVVLIDDDRRSDKNDCDTGAKKNRTVLATHQTRPMITRLNWIAQTFPYFFPLNSKFISHCLA